MKRGGFAVTGERGTVKLGILYRELRVDPESVNEDDRTVDLAFSSETPVARWYGDEVLDHSPGAVDLTRLNNGAPFLLDHRGDYDNHVGNVVKAWTDNGIGRAKVRIKDSPKGDQILKEMRNGDRPKISVGYQVNEMVREKSDDTGDTYRATRWTPHEISSVAMPADDTVGVGRSLEGDAAGLDTIIINPKGVRMDNVTEGQGEGAPAAGAGATIEVRGQGTAPDPQAAIVAAMNGERKRVKDILDLGKVVNMSDKAQDAVRAGLTFDQFKNDVYLARADEERPLGSIPGDIGAGKRDVERFSLFRFAKALGERNTKGAEHEFEMSQAVAQSLGKEARGGYIPFDVLVRGFQKPSEVMVDPAVMRARRGLMQRAQAVGTANLGGYLVGTDHRPDLFVELLRNKSMVLALGARVMGGLVGNVDIPKQIGAAQAVWLGEGGNTTASTLTLGQIVLSPNTISGRVDITRRLMNQASPSAEALVRDDLMQIIALGIDEAAIAGTGANNQPTGIINAAGVAITSLGTNGGPPTWPAVVDQETQVAVNNADIGSLALLTSVKARGKLKTTDATAGGFGQFLWAKDNTVNGYDAYASNQVPSNLTKGTGTGLSASIFGNWNDIMIGEWGAFDIEVDKITNGDSGGYVLRAFQDVDIKLRRAQSFDVILDLQT